MEKITIELETEVEFKRAGVVFRVDTGTLPVEMITELVYHGLTQKIGDAAAGVKDDSDAALEKMTAVYESLQANRWGRERGVTTGPAWMPYAIAIVRKLLGDVNKKAYDAIPSDDQKGRVAFLTGLFDGLAEPLRKNIQDEATLAHAAAQEKARADKALLKALGAASGL